MLFPIIRKITSQIFNDFYLFFHPSVAWLQTNLRIYILIKALPNMNIKINIEIVF